MSSDSIPSADDLLKAFQKKAKIQKTTSTKKLSEQHDPVVSLSTHALNHTPISFALLGPAKEFIPLPVQLKFIDNSMPSSDEVPPHHARVPTLEITSTTTPNTFTLESLLQLKDQCLPHDRLPVEFLIDLNTRELGNVLIAYQQHDDPDNKIDMIIGGVVSTHMVYWSRFANTEFKLRRILNIFSFFVSPLARGMGVGSILLDLLVYFTNNPTNTMVQSSPLIPFQCDEISLEVRQTNESAIQLYKRKGMTVENIEDDYYEIGKTKKDRRMNEMVVSADKYLYSSAFNKGVSKDS